MTAKDFLFQLERLDQLINAKIAERTQLWEMATKITPEISGMPHGTEVSDKVGNIAAKLADLAMETDALVDRYVKCKREAIEVLEQLSPLEYGAIHRHYIRHMTWEEVADDMSCSLAQIYRYRKKGLQKIKMIVNDIE